MIVRDLPTLTCEHCASPMSLQKALGQREIWECSNGKCKSRQYMFTTKALLHEPSEPKTQTDDRRCVTCGASFEPVSMDTYICDFCRANVGEKHVFLN